MAGGAVIKYWAEPAHVNRIAVGSCLCVAMEFGNADSQGVGTIMADTTGVQSAPGTKFKVSTEFREDYVPTFTSNTKRSERRHKNEPVHQTDSLVNFASLAATVIESND
ncbi:hypothetical protein CBL_11673 [Carabus blaptoides fortunei]